MELIYKLIRLFLPNRGHGFSVTETKKSITPEDWFAGSGKLTERFGAATVIRPDGQWTDFAPREEIQKFSWGDTWGCQTYGTENAVQFIQRAEYGVSEEYSERYLFILSRIRNGIGGSPNEVAEQWRKNGNLNYDLLPVENINSWNEFDSPNPMTPSLITEGKKWLEKWNFAHEWNWNFTHDKIKDLLRYSPLGIGVAAWYYNGTKGVYYKPSYAQDNHWVVLCGYVEGKYWLIYDSYKDNGEMFKKLDWNYPFAFMKRYYVEKKTGSEQDGFNRGKSLYERFLGKHVMRVQTDKGGHGEIYLVGAKKKSTALGADETIVEYEGWATNSQFLRDSVNIGLRQATTNKILFGIKEDEFKDLTTYCVTQGIKVETQMDAKGEMNLN